MVRLRSKVAIYFIVPVPLTLNLLKVNNFFRAIPLALNHLK